MKRHFRRWSGEIEHISNLAAVLACNTWRERMVSNLSHELFHQLAYETIHVCASNQTMVMTLFYNELQTKLLPDVL